MNSPPEESRDSKNSPCWRRDYQSQIHFTLTENSRHWDREGWSEISREEGSLAEDGTEQIIPSPALSEKIPKENGSRNAVSHTRGHLSFHAGNDSSYPSGKLLETGASSPFLYRVEEYAENMIYQIVLMTNCSVFSQKQSIRRPDNMISLFAESAQFNERTPKH